MKQHQQKQRKQLLYKALYYGARYKEQRKLDAFRAKLENATPEELVALAVNLIVTRGSLQESRAWLKPFLPKDKAQLHPMDLGALSYPG